jgi:AAA+ ATPase superfamily predicted ATPase
MKNPFFFGGLVFEENFCNRKKEIEELKRDIINGQNVLIYAPRRFGKTSLIYKVKEELKDFKFLYIDFMTITSVEEFINIYFNKIAKSLETPLDKTIKFFKEVLNFRPSIKATVNDTGNVSFGLSFSKKETSNVLEEILNLPLKYSEKYNICIVFDEFQEIENLEIENKLRSIIQKHSNKVSYIFLGSKKSIINKMFSDVKRPFYKSVKHLILNPISKEEWSKCIKKSFDNTNKKIDDMFIDKIFNITKGFPHYTQEICYEIWELTDNEVNEDIFNKAINNILLKEKEYFIALWDNLTKNQKIALKIIVLNNGENIYSNEYISNMNIKISSLQTAIKNLIQKDLIDKKDDIYYLQDPFFEFWLRNYKD